MVEVIAQARQSPARGTGTPNRRLQALPTDERHAVKAFLKAFLDQRRRGVSHEDMVVPPLSPDTAKVLFECLDSDS